MHRIYVLVAAVSLLSGALMVGACLSEEAEHQSFVIAWNYDTSGYLETCGCSAHQLGGLAKRATLIEQLRANQQVLALEGAHIVDDAGEFKLFKGETIIHALNSMGYHALMLGIREAQQGPDGLLTLVETAEFPCFSANLVVKDKPWPEPTTTAEIAGIAVGITGASQPAAVSFELPEGMGFAEPEEALTAIIPLLREDTDLVVVCLEGERTWLDSMVSRFSNDVDLFLTGDRAEATADLGFVAHPPRLNNFKYGKYLGVVTVDPSGEGFVFSGTNMPLEDTLADAPAVTEIMEQFFRPQLKDRFFGTLKQDLTQLYLPADYCMDCHLEAYEAYSSSGHALAFDTLQEAGQLYNPDCMSCHVVYDADTDELHSMNCVSCHSNITEDHVWAALDGEVQRPEEPVASYTYEWCGQCHDPLNSVPFAAHWPQYVQQIYHGGDMSAAEQAAEAMRLDLGEPPPDAH